MKMRYKVWMLSKQRVSNAPELLKRVKGVFDCGNAQLRSTALVMFGCWADFAQDSAHVRYLILSSMVSSEELEVKASVLAAGCFCELSDDFGSVVLHMLGSLLTSSDTPYPLGWPEHVPFQKCSLSIVNMAYKTGLDLVLNSQEEELWSTMVCPLLILACKSPTLASKQEKGWEHNCADTTHREGIPVSQGWELSLNLSVQLWNSSPLDLPIHLGKFHAVVHFGPSFQVPGLTEESSFRVSDAWESGDLVDLNERLFHHAVYGDRMMRSSDHADGTMGFESLEVNERGVGFSNSLLDVSGFPMGKYRMKWHSCFIDGEGS